MQYMPNRTNWRLWGGGALAALLIAAGLAFGFDMFSDGGAVFDTPTAEQTE